MALRLFRQHSGVVSMIRITLTKTVPCLGRGVSSSAKLGESITLTDDESTIVCWHPEPHFPYECSRPLPEEKTNETHSVLKVQSVDEVRSLLIQKKEEFVRQELMNITHTTKHRWFPRSRDKYAKKTPPDREYL